MGGAAAHGCRADRARGRRTARAGRDQRYEQSRAPRPDQGRLRGAGRARRPARSRAAGRGDAGDRAPDGTDRGARSVAVSAVLLAVDGDSLAHRAYHALPKNLQRAGGGPSNALVGFSNMLIRLWERERPDAVLVAWDTLTVPTYRHEALPAYQSGREFDDALLEQLDLLPGLVESFGFACAKAPGYEADDFLAAAARAWPGPVLIATSDRDAFQLAADRVTILQPTKGVSEVARVGPAEVRERYGVEPEQVPDFVALRGDPSDRIPGARGVGPKKAADVLREYGTLEAALAAGRFAAEAEDLRLFRRIATMDASAPLPPLAQQTPTWAEASSRARELGLGQLAGRLAALGG
ncbi:MAG: 5'-3' exonuclease [Actinobacteria bacterium]|nr:MAG: 5'-3' exonuclease [Actinomycetota bacterium]